MERRFTVEEPDMRASGWLCGVFSLVVMKQFFHNWSSGRSVFMPVVLFVLLVAYIVAILIHERTILTVDGDRISTKKERFHGSDISRILIYSGKAAEIFVGERCIARVADNCPGCAQLMQWAEEQGIDCQESERPLPARNERIFITAIVVILIACGIGAAVYYCMNI